MLKDTESPVIRDLSVYLDSYIYFLIYVSEEHSEKVVQIYRENYFEEFNQS